ncbi:MAG: hypothetical protein Tsb0027_08010 [Wenzhouxiangellaceae bacterium]
MINTNLDAAIKRLRAPLYFSIVIFLLVGAFGGLLLFNQVWVLGSASLIGSTIFAIALYNQFNDGIEDLTLAQRHALEIEINYWRYGRMLANSDEEFCSLGFPVQYRGVWIEGIKGENHNGIESFEIRAVIKPDTESVPIDYLPYKINEADSFDKAKQLIDEMYESNELVEYKGKIMY